MKEKSIDKPKHFIELFLTLLEVGIKKLKLILFPMVITLEYMKQN